MDLNGFTLSRRTANLMFLPIDHLMSGTLLAPSPERVPAFYREEYAEQVWDKDGSYMAECRKLNGTTCKTCGDSGWVASGTWAFLMADAAPCPDCDMLRRRHQTEKLRMSFAGVPMTRQSMIVLPAA